VKNKKSNKTVVKHKNSQRRLLRKRFITKQNMYATEDVLQENCMFLEKKKNERMWISFDNTLWCN
jgi:hypothetical protein